MHAEFKEEELTYVETCDSDLIKAAKDKDKNHHLNNITTLQPQMKQGDKNGNQLPTGAANKTTTNQATATTKAAKRTFDMFAEDEEFDLSVIIYYT